MNYETLLNSLGDDCSPVTTLPQHICKDLNDKNTQIEYLQSGVQYLKQKVNEIERYQSKDCIIFRILPLMSNTNITDDVIYTINNALGVSMGHRDLVACHELGAVRNPRRPPPIIAKFNNFDLKNRI